MSVLCSQIVCTVPAPKEEKKSTNTNTKLKKLKKHIAGFRSCVICYESFDLLGESGEE